VRSGIQAGDTDARARAGSSTATGSTRCLVDRRTRGRLSVVRVAAAGASAVAACVLVSCSAAPGQPEATGSGSSDSSTSAVQTFPGVVSTGTSNPATIAATGTPSSAGSPLASTPPVSVSAAPSAVSSARPPDCQADQLSPSASGGPVAGAEQIVFLLRNTGASSCWLSGFPTLYGVTASGATTLLPFLQSDKSMIVEDTLGPGVVLPGGLGAFRAVLQLNDCVATRFSYHELRIRLSGDQVIHMPYPDEMALSGCAGGISQVGPYSPLAES